jgi:unsaturated chondroitin disaccharide hydrolase
MLINQNSDDTFSDLWDNLQVKVNRMITQLEGKSPHKAADDGIYDDMRRDWWTSGFWPGILWIMYDVTGKEHYRNEAWNWDEPFEQCMVKDSNLHHDVGFQFLPTAVIKHKLSGDADGRRRGLQAANFLAGRFNIAGNFIRAWNPIQNKEAWNFHNTGWAIIDSMMNISLLFWASDEINDPRFSHIAKAHADTVLEHFIREDGSVCHICSFNPETGEFIESIGGQGFGPVSAWSRGAAWALYGMANTYRYTGELRYLHAAKKVAHFFIASLEEDYIPLWDFRVSNRHNEPRDTAAASCAASGLLEIAALVPQTEAGIYEHAAKCILNSLTEHYGTWDIRSIKVFCGKAQAIGPQGKI